MKYPNIQVNHVLADENWTVWDIKTRHGGDDISERIYAIKIAREDEWEGDILCEAVIKGLEKIESELETKAFLDRVDQQIADREIEKRYGAIGMRNEGLT